VKVALVISSLSLGGASRVMSLLANYWAERGDEVVLITLDTVSTDAFALHPAIHRVALDMMGDSNGFAAALANNAKRLLGLRRSVAASGASVVLSFEDRTNVMVLVATLGMRLRRVVCERTDVLRHRIGRVWPVLRRMTYPLAAGLVVQTRALLPWGRSVMFGRPRVHVVPNPIPLERYTCGPLAERPQTIVAVGRLEPEKGYDVLLAAFATIAREFPQWELLIAGDGSQREPLRDLVHELGLEKQVRLVGYIANPCDVLAAGSIFVMSSRYEGFPNALLEAMACGLPVVSTACVGAVELVADGVSGILVAVDNCDELAHAIRRLVGDAQFRHRLGSAARNVAERYSLDAVMQEWDALVSPTCLRSYS
jgi:GalNAc-alpha-(1->4)-GalNAc-alpha-(1->3)-diNAcBac-PP-undecaprenol alpha-1,4-N-acetyl-D-galactosaminyltransferase